MFRSIAIEALNMSAKNQESVESPCVGECRLDSGSGLCLGCLRSLDEISAWSRISRDEQRRILTAVARRREALEQ